MSSNSDQIMLAFSYIQTTAFLVLLRVPFCSSLAIERSISSRESQSNGTQTSQNKCGFTGNSDLYGIGIRLGYYTQALSVWFANYFVFSEARELRSVNLLFLVALFIALIWLSHQSQQTYAIEVFLLLRLLFATWYVGVLDRSRFSKKHGRKRIMRVVIRECALLGMLSYTVWFAWIGLDRMEKTPCGTWIFFAAKLNLYGGYRSAFKVLSISALSFGLIKQSDTASQLFQHWRSTDIRSPDYFARLQRALLVQHYNNDVSCGNSCNGQNPHTASEEIHSVRNSESGASSPSPAIFVTSDEACEDASIVSGHARNSEPSQSDSPQQNVSDAAVQCHLRDCPSEDQLAESHIRSHTSSHMTLEELPSLESLIEAQDWLEAILAVDVADHSAWCYQVPCLPMKVFLPSLHSPKKTHKRISALHALRPFRFSILIPLARHINSLCKFGWYHYPIMLEAAMRDPCHKRVSKSTLLATIALHKAQLPTNRPAPHVLWSACASLAMCVELILSIELSLYWNRVGGMGNVGAPGQLIPAIIGIGGFVKVVWVWWSVEKGVEEVGDGVGKEVRECLEVYRRLKQEREGSGKKEKTVDTGTAKG